MGLFKKKTKLQSYDDRIQKPVIKASICNGEQVAGFKDIHTGKFEEVMLIRNSEDLEQFKAMYDIQREIEKLILKILMKRHFFPLLVWISSHGIQESGNSKQ